MDINTQLIHGYPVFDGQTGASSIPLYQASTFQQGGIDQPQDFTYSRFGNPTRQALEEAIAAIEGGRCGFAFASGMAAISSVLLLFEAGDHLVMCKSIYGGTFTLAETVLKRFGIRVTYVDEADPAAWEQAICPDTKALYLETPSNPLLKITDIRKAATLAKERGLISIIDNTFMTPQFQSPLSLGVDIVIHSATKFLNGHSDVVAGLVVTNDLELAEGIRQQQTVLGSILGVEDCWLVLRGMKTMGLRMAQSAATAQQIAAFLAAAPQVRTVHYPGLSGHPGAAVHASQATSGGAVLSFELADREAVLSFAAAVKLPITAVSLGGVESILSYPATMSHACVPPEERTKQGITDGLLRLSVGIEDACDLLADLQQALAQLTPAASKTVPAATPS